MARPTHLPDDLSDQRVLLTGGTSGIGLDAAHRLLERGASVIVVGSTRRKGERAEADLRERAGAGAEVEFLQADLSLVANAAELAERVRERWPEGLDVLVNNAGTLHHPDDPTQEGLDHLFAVNFLAAVRLTRELLPALEARAPTRIVNVASAGHYDAGKFHPFSMRDPAQHTMWDAYSRSKLCLVAWTRELARRLEERGGDGGGRVSANSLHPGFIPGTQLVDVLPLGVGNLVKLASWLPWPRTRSVEDGGRAIAWLAASHDVEHTGGYYHGPKLREPSSAARDAAFVRELWDASAELAGVAGELPAAPDPA